MFAILIVVLVVLGFFQFNFNNEYYYFQRVHQLASHNIIQTNPKVEIYKAEVSLIHMKNCVPAICTIENINLFTKKDDKASFFSISVYLLPKFQFESLSLKLKVNCVYTVRWGICSPVYYIFILLYYTIQPII